jgi:hypothetical protein
MLIRSRIALTEHVLVPGKSISATFQLLHTCPGHSRTYSGALRTWSVVLRTYPGLDMCPTASV